MRVRQSGKYVVTLPENELKCLLADVLGVPGQYREGRVTVVSRANEFIFTFVQNEYVPNSEDEEAMK